MRKSRDRGHRCSRFHSSLREGDGRKLWEVADGRSDRYSGRCGAGDTDGPGVRQCLQPRGYVHSVTKQVPGAHHHVTDVHVDAEVDVPVCRQTRVRFGQRSLRFHRALDGINGTSKLRKNTVARRVRYAAPVVCNVPVEDRAGRPVWAGWLPSST